MPCDDTLYRRYLGGEEAALRELMERYGDPLTRYLNSMLHDVHRAEDLMIDAFARLVTKRPSIRENGFKPYLYKIARNLALRHRGSGKPTTFGIADLAQESQSPELLEELVVARERTAALYLCMGQLSPDYREALYLVYLEGMSYCDAAAVMRKSEKQLDNLVQRGKKSLRGHLEKEGITGAYN